MLRYETLFLCVPEITADEIAALQTNFDKLIEQHKAHTISFDRWGKYKLAYPVRKNEYGVYFLVRFEVDENNKTALLTAINTFFAIKYNDLVMRHLSSVLEPRQSLEYQRPESLEEMPSRDMETRDTRGNGRGRRSYHKEATHPRSSEQFEELASMPGELDIEEIEENV